MMTSGIRGPIVVTHEGGVKFAAQIRSHRLIVDQSLGAGGQDTGPSPLELLGAGLGTCIAYYVQQFCHSRGLPYDPLQVEVEQHSAQAPHRIGLFVVRVILPHEFPESKREMIERVARSCPAHNTLTRAAEVAVTIESGVAAGG